MGATEHSKRATCCPIAFEEGHDISGDLVNRLMKFGLIGISALETAHEELEICVGVSLLSLRECHRPSPSLLQQLVRESVFFALAKLREDAEILEGTRIARDLSAGGDVAK